MDRKILMSDPYDPYDYVVYNSLEKDEAELEHKLTFHRLCTFLRRFDDIEQYSVEYWNELFDCFCIPGEHEEKFSSIEQLKECLTFEACSKRLDS